MFYASGLLILCIPKLAHQGLWSSRACAVFIQCFELIGPFASSRVPWDVAIQRLKWDVETYGNLWKPMETYGNPWKPSYVKGQPRQPTFNLRRYKTPEPPWLWPKLWWNSPAPGKRSEITTVGKKKRLPILLMENSTSNSIIVTKHIAELPEKQMSYYIVYIYIYIYICIYQSY